MRQISNRNSRIGRRTFLKGTAAGSSFALRVIPGKASRPISKVPADRPRVIQMNDDSIAFYRYCVTERPTARDLEAMVDLFARANVDTLTHYVHCRWQAFYDSKVVEVSACP